MYSPTTFFPYNLLFECGTSLPHPQPLRQDPLLLGSLLYPHRELGASGTNATVSGVSALLVLPSPPSLLPMSPAGDPTGHQCSQACPFQHAGLAWTIRQPKTAMEPQLTETTRQGLKGPITLSPPWGFSAAWLLGPWPPRGHLCPHSASPVSIHLPVCSPPHWILSASTSSHFRVLLCPTRSSWVQLIPLRRRGIM